MRVLNKAFLLFNLLFVVMNIYSQEQKEVVLDDLLPPSAPGFTILDVSPEIIQTPKTGKEFVLSTINLFNDGFSLPKNFAFEITPAFFNKNKPVDFPTLQGLKFDPQTQKFNQNIFAPARFVKISIASVFADTSTNVLLSNTNHLSFGLRTTLIKVNRKNRIEKREKLIKDIYNFNVNNPDISFDDYIAGTKDIWNNYNKIRDARPLFQLEAAVAHSWAFENNVFENALPFKTGIWTNLAFSFPLYNEKEMLENDQYDNLADEKKYLNATFLLRYVKSRYDGVKKFDDRIGVFDAGGRIEFEFKRVTFGGEYIHRTAPGESQDSDRFSGLLQIRINPKFYLMGSIGKNFGKVNNLISALGINWGFGQEKIVEKISPQ